ncbi:Double-stranded RNA binding motif [Musa troglodytarum]|uniref:Double-stranded RNA binding motif n=1 Tax=Musa troglodytarum TaxID=320322 RepID=A0A9E7KKV0_9LILI|nr:Double-stranded RNA binding motif [Musa troglodytarum]
MAEEFMHKNRLQEYTQRSSITLPLYQTINEGTPHAPEFRSTVIVDGKNFTSPCTFPTKKAAEQCAAKFALEGIRIINKNKGLSLIHNDTILCKLILHEYSVKMSMNLPTYETSHKPGLIPAFVSSVLFDNKTFKGETAMSKKEAERVAARAVIKYILGNCDTGDIMRQIMESKDKHYAVVHRGKGSCSSLARNAETSDPSSSIQENKMLAPLIYDMPHGYPEAFASVPANSAAADSLYSAKEEYAGKQCSALIESWNSLSTPTVTVVAGGSTNGASGTDFVEPHMLLPIQGKAEVPSDDPTSHARDVVPISSKGRSRENNEEQCQLKKARVDGQIVLIAYFLLLFHEFMRSMIALGAGSAKRGVLQRYASFRFMAWFLWTDNFVY